MILIEEYLPLVSACATGLFSLFLIRIFFLIWKNSAPLWSGLFIFLRLVALAILSLIIWEIFINADFEEKDVIDPFKEPHRLAVIQDQSGSMDFKVFNNKSRVDISKDIWESIEEHSKDISKEDLEIKRFYFADKLVNDASLGELDRSSSQLEKSILQVLAQWEVEGLIIVSDGGNSAGYFSKNLIKRLENYRMLIVATHHEDSLAFDTNLQRIKVRKKDPTHVEVLITAGPAIANNPLPQKDIQVILKIDGRNSKMISRPLVPRDTFMIEVPKGEPGWHELSVEIIPDENELSVLNNIRRGAFERTLRRKILFIHKVNRMEDRELQRLIKENYKGDVDVLSIENTNQLDLINPKDYAALWLLNISPEDTPKPLLNALHEGSLGFCLIGLDCAEAWSDEDLNDFPISSVEGDIIRTAGAEKEFSVTQEPSDTFYKTLRSMPYQRAVIPIQKSQDSIISLNASLRNTQWPMVLSYTKKGHIMAAILAEDTWKWLRSRNESIRMFHSELYSTLMDHFISPYREKRLSIEVRPGGKEQLELITNIKAKSSNIGPLRNVKVEITQAGEKTPYSALKIEDFYQSKTAIEKNIVYFSKGSAYSEYGEEQSQTEPFLIESIEKEKSDTFVHFDRLQNICTSENHKLVLASDSNDSIKELLSGYKSEQKILKVRKRDARREMFFALFLIALLFIEWKLEKWVRETRTGT